jgi:NarL family two-component system sensor histidine kinase LiaS
VSQEADGTSISSVPIRGRDQQIVGALVEKSWPVNQWTILGLSGALVLIFSIPVIILASIIGAIFGFLIARGLTKRIQRLFFAADNWSRGNFSVFVSDKSGDELGQLAQRLNNMAEQLQNLLQTSQKFAKLEERNRLSRDLHDSVKQQAFSIAMQVRAAKGLLVSDALEAQEHLHEAEQLVHLMQQELTALIYELRPTALENMQFAAALRELVAVWTRQTGILVSMQIEDERRLPASLEDALLRVTQESLANVARHSKATTVQIVLLCKQDAVDLFISDNGQGFAASINKSSGIGLLSIHERIEKLGGLIDVKSQPGHGTSIAVHCKYDDVALPAQGV